MMVATGWVGALSLWMSLWFKRSHHGVIVVILVTLAAYGACDLILRWGMEQAEFSDWWIIWCPYGMQKLLELEFHYPGIFGGALPWPRHCAMILGATSLLLGISALVLRRRAIGRLWALRRSRQVIAHAATIQRAPILWRDLQGRSWGHHLIRQLPLIVLTTGTMGTLAWLSASGAAQARVVKVYRVTMMVWWLVVCLRLALDAVVTITREIQGRSWPVLLATPLSSGAILRQKAEAVLWRNVAGWLPLCVGPACYGIVMAHRMFNDPGLFPAGWPGADLDPRDLGLVDHRGDALGLASRS